MHNDMHGRRRHIDVYSRNTHFIYKHACDGRADSSMKCNVTGGWMRQRELEIAFAPLDRSIARQTIYESGLCDTCLCVQKKTNQIRLMSVDFLSSFRNRRLFIYRRTNGVEKLIYGSLVHRLIKPIHRKQVNYFFIIA